MIETSYWLGEGTRALAAPHSSHQGASCGLKTNVCFKIAQQDRETEERTKITDSLKQPQLTDQSCRQIMKWTEESYMPCAFGSLSIEKWSKCCALHLVVKLKNPFSNFGRFEHAFKQVYNHNPNLKSNLECRQSKASTTQAVQNRVVPSSKFPRSLKILKNIKL